MEGDFRERAQRFKRGQKVYVSLFRAEQYAEAGVLAVNTEDPNSLGFRGNLLLRLLRVVGPTFQRHRYWKRGNQVVVLASNVYPTLGAMQRYYER